MDHDIKVLIFGIIIGGMLTATLIISLLGQSGANKECELHLPRTESCQLKWVKK